MARLSEKQLEQYDSGLFFPGRNSIQLVELVRGYRRAAALEDMLEDWLASANLYSDIPLMERTEALLAEGDECRL